MPTVIREDVYRFCKDCKYLKIMQLGPKDKIHYCGQNFNKNRKNADILKVEGDISFDLSEEFELPDAKDCPCSLEFLMLKELQ